MKRLISILLLSFVIIGFTSCKKEPKLHKVKYDVTFIEVPHWASSNYIEAICVPNYNDDQPAMTYNMAMSGHWDYEYWELKDGDKVMFYLWAQLGYLYEMRLYIDDVEVGYKKIKISDSNYFEYTVLEESGIDIDGDDNITFVYSE